MGHRVTAIILAEIGSTGCIATGCCYFLPPLFVGGLFPPLFLEGREIIMMSSVVKARKSIVRSDYQNAFNLDRSGVS